MVEVVSVRFKSKGKVYSFDPAGISISKGDFVVVETAKGLEFAECAQGNHTVEDAAVIPPLRPVIRLATDEDVRRAEANRKKEAEAFSICREKIEQHGLDMKLVDVEYNFEGNKVLFFFTSDGRVDFRELVKDLASIFKTRIELRQIGIRDEARMLGGLGICGRPFCCAQFLDDFQPVSIKMAKTQGLSLNPTKISGTCGRLMCCLKYEQDAYEDLVKNVPKVDAFVDTPAGKGSVLDVNILRGTARVRLEEASDNTTIKTFPVEELEILGGKAKRAEYLALKAEGKLPAEETRRRPVPHTAERSAPAERGKAETPARDVPRPERNGKSGEHSRNRRNSGKKPPVKHQAPGKPAEQPMPPASENAAKPAGSRPRHRRRRPKGASGAKPGGETKPQQ